MSSEEFRRRYVGEQTIPIAAKDHPLCRVAIKLLAKRLTRAKALLESIDVAAPGIARRDADCQTITTHFGDDVLRDLGLPASLVSSLRVGLSLEHDMVRAIRDRKEGKLSMDTTEEEARLLQLDRLMSELDVARMGGEVNE